MYYLLQQNGAKDNIPGKKTVFDNYPIRDSRFRRVYRVGYKTQSDSSRHGEDPISEYLWATIFESRYQNGSSDAISDPPVVEAEWETLFATQSEENLAQLIRNGELDLVHAPPLFAVNLEIFTRLAALQVWQIGFW